MPLRIISGKYKSRKIYSVPASKLHTGMQKSTLRPTGDRARVMLFDILVNKADFSGLRCLDLFAGTGSFGFECLSRGADFCTFVDKSDKSARIISKTANELDCSKQIDFVKDDVIKFLNSDNGKYDIIFADPPYEYTHYGELSEKIIKNKFLIGIIEYNVAGSVNNFIKDGFEAEVRKAGITSFKILTDSSL